MSRFSLCLLFLVGIAFVYGKTAIKPNMVTEALFTIDENHWQRLLSDPLRYVDLSIVADVVYDGHVRENVDLQITGEESTSFCVERGTSKFSWMLDTVDADKTIQGSNILYFHNSYNDPSFMREMLSSYYLDDASSTPRIGYVNLTIQVGNETIPQGLYIISEDVDHHFIQQRYEGSRGALYKPGYPSGTLQYYGEDIYKYPNLTLIFAQTAQALGYIHFVNILNESPLDIEALEGIANVEHILKHMAACSMIGNFNSATGNGDNFYLFMKSYSSLEYGKAEILPIHFYETLGCSTCGGRLELDDIIHWDILHPSCPNSDSSELPLLQLLEIDVYRNFYLNEIASILEFSFIHSFVSDAIAYNRFTIEPYLNQSANFYSYDEFLCAIGQSSDTLCSIPSIPDFISARAEAVKDQLRSIGYRPPMKQFSTAGILVPLIIVLIIPMILY